MAVRNRIRRGLARFHWRGATGLALLLVVGGMVLWASQLAWALGKGKESVMADRPAIFASAAPKDEAADVKRLKRQVESLRAENEQLMQAIQMLAEEIQWLHGEDQAANSPRNDAQETDSDKKSSKSNKIHPDFAAELFALEQELMDEIDAPVIEAELKRRLDKFRDALAESEAEARPQQKKSNPPAELGPPDVSELEKFRQEYMVLLAAKLNRTKTMREALHRQGRLSPETAVAMDALIVDLMEKLLALKEDAASRQEEKSNQSRPDDSTNFIPVPTTPASSIEEPASQPTSTATATATATPGASEFDLAWNATEEFKVELDPQGNGATVSFFDSTLGLLIHVKTPLRQLPELLEHLGEKIKPQRDAPTLAPPFMPEGTTVPHYADPATEDFGTGPEKAPSSEDGFSPPEEPESKSKPTNPSDPFFKDPTADVS